MQNSALSCFHIDTVILVLWFVFAFITLFRLTIVRMSIPMTSFEVSR